MQWLFCTNFKFRFLSSIRPDSNDVTLSLGLAEEILPVDLMSSLRGAMSDPENSEFKIHADKPLSVNNELGTSHFCLLTRTVLLLYTPDIPCVTRDLVWSEMVKISISKASDRMKKYF